MSSDSSVCHHLTNCRFGRMRKKSYFSASITKAKRIRKRGREEEAWCMWAAVKKKREGKKNKKKMIWLYRWMLYPTWQAEIISHYSKFDAPLTRTCRPEGDIHYIYIRYYIHIFLDISRHRTWYLKNIFLFLFTKIFFKVYLEIEEFWFSNCIEHSV